MDPTLLFALLLLGTLFSFGTFVLSGFVFFTAKTFLQRMDERDARWEKRVQELPADVTGARIIELLEKHGIRLPPEVPPVADEELRAIVQGYCAEGVKLAEQAKRASPQLTSLDKFTVARSYVVEQLTRANLTSRVTPRDLALFVEQAVADVRALRPKR